MRTLILAFAFVLGVAFTVPLSTTAAPAKASTGVANETAGVSRIA
jgi:hypothetical protein